MICRCGAARLDEARRRGETRGGARRRGRVARFVPLPLSARGGSNLKCDDKWCARGAPFNYKLAGARRPRGRGRGGRVVGRGARGAQDSVLGLDNLHKCMGDAGGNAGDANGCCLSGAKSNSGRVRCKQRPPVSGSYLHRNFIIHKVAMSK